MDLSRFRALALLLALPAHPTPRTARQRLLCTPRASVQAPGAAHHPASPAAHPPLTWAGSAPHSAGVAVATAVGALRGRPKPQNQDAFLVEAVQPAPGCSCAVVAVYDGHGERGQEAAQLAARHMAGALRAAAHRALAAGDEGSTRAVANLSRPAALAAGSACLTRAAARECLRQAFASTAAAAAQNGEVMRGSGCTAVVCMVLEDSVVTAWVGDSRAVIGTAVAPAASPGSGSIAAPRYIARQLTRDHTPSRPSEAQRVVTAGGWLLRAGARTAAGSPLRVCLPMRQKSMLLARGSKAAATNLAVVGGLSVTRSLGDLKFAPAGVVPTPDVVVLPRGAAPRRQQQPGGGGSGGSWLPEWLQRWQQGEQDELGGGAAADMQGLQDAARSAQQEAAQQAPAEVLVVATDGLWEMVGSQEAVELAGAAGSPQEAAALLLRTAGERWEQRFGGRVRDDITVAVAYL